MTNSKILEKVIKKAVDNEYSPHKESYLKSYDFKLHLSKTIHSKGYYQYIFSHDFAKAFWGEELLDEGYKDFKENECKYVWQAHLRSMVLEKEPLKYLEKFLDKE